MHMNFCKKGRPMGGLSYFPEMPAVRTLATYYLYLLLCQPKKKRC